jgi:hypothetical protein
MPVFITYNYICILSFIILIIIIKGLKKTSNKTTGSVNQKKRKVEENWEDTSDSDDCVDFLSHKQPKRKLVISNNSRLKESSERLEEGTQLDELLYENNNNAGIYHI